MRPNYLRKKNSRYILSIVSIIGLVLVIFAGFAELHAYQFCASLRLADDASTPEKKAEYLGQFINDIENADLPAHGSWFINTRQNSVKEQVAVLESLKTRCDETAGLPRESFGFAQGMTQITGQEFDHSLDNSGEIIATAFKVKRGWIVCWGWLVPLALLIVLLLRRAFS